MRGASFAAAIGLATLAALAQENAPPGWLKGDLVSWSGTPRNGEFVFRTNGDQIYSCGYDEKTYIERDNRRITLVGADKGDRLEVVSDYKKDSAGCYARLIHVLDPQRTYIVPGVRPRVKQPSRTAELFGPRGNMSISGLVMKVSSSVLTLKSRSGEYQTIRLRPDTRYAADGQMADAESLRVNTLVYVRCGRNLDNEVEAYQVVSGEIMRPEP